MSSMVAREASKNKSIDLCLSSRSIYFGSNMGKKVPKDKRQLSLFSDLHTHACTHGHTQF